MTLSNILLILLLTLQIPAALVVLARLSKGPFRRPPLQPEQPNPDVLGTVSIVVPTLNEAQRISPCLAGLTRQSYEVREIIVVDSYSQDETPNLVLKAQQQDPRFRLINDDPLPSDWVGRPWALHTGFLHSSPKSEWVLGIDADTYPAPGLVASVIQAAEAEKFDIVSLSPRFILEYPGEIWLQPALLMTLVYRFGPTGTEDAPERVMANGQCFLSRRKVLEALGGYHSARSSFCDDVTLARVAATSGYKVGFLDGAKVLKVRMYEGAKQTWQEWGRSLDLKDASGKLQLWGDVALLLGVQGLPIPVLIILLSWQLLGGSGMLLTIALGLNLGLVVVRWALCGAIAQSYDLTSAKIPWVFWLSPLADPLAFLRILLSSLQTSIQWRGREYKQSEILKNQG